MVRAEWARLMRERREALDLRTDFLLRGETYVDLDEEGRVVRHAPDGTVIEIIAAAARSTD